MSLEKLMTQPVAAVAMDDTLAVVKYIFDKTTFHHLLVVNNKKLVGVLSDRDLFKALSPNIGTAAESAKDLASLNKKVHQIMTRQPIALLANASVYEAIAIFNQNNISCIPVIDESNEPIGVLSWRDILKYIEQKHNEKGQSPQKENTKANIAAKAE